MIQIIHFRNVVLRLQHLSERGEGGGVDGGGVGGACVWSVSHGDSVVAAPLTLLGAGKVLGMSGRCINVNTAGHLLLNSRTRACAEALLPVPRVLSKSEFNWETGTSASAHAQVREGNKLLITNAALH